MNEEMYIKILHAMGLIFLELPCSLFSHSTIQKLQFYALCHGGEYTHTHCFPSLPIHHKSVDLWIHVSSFSPIHPSTHPSTLHSYVLLTLATAPFYLSCVLLYILDFTTNRKVLTICKIGDRVGNFS